MKTSCVALAAIMVLGACSGSSQQEPTAVLSDEPTATATSEDPLLAPTYDITGENPFVVRGPFSPDDAISAAAASFSKQFILELETGDVFLVDVDSDKLPIPPGSGASGGSVWVTWNDSDSINAELNGQRYVVYLDGTTLAGPTPVSGEPPAALVFGGTSQSGAFSTGVLSSGAGGVIVRAEPDGETWHISAADLPHWAPTRDLLAVHGNLCEYDLLIYEPVSRDLLNLTPDAPPIPFSAWSADSSQIAAFTANEGSPEIRLIDVTTGEQSVVLRTAVDGRFIPLQWSPDGKHLIFTHDPAPFVPCTSEWGGASVVDQNFGGP